MLSIYTQFFFAVLNKPFSPKVTLISPIADAPPPTLVMFGDRTARATSPGPTPAGAYFVAKKSNTA